MKTPIITDQSIANRVRMQISLLDGYDKELTICKTRVKDLEISISKIENDILPNLMEELELDTLSLNDGTTLTLQNTLWLRVNKPECEQGWAILKARGNAGIIKPVVKIVVSQTEDKKEIDTLINIIKNSIEFEKIELDFEYNAQTLSAFGRELAEEGAMLDESIFKTSIKRTVKIKQKTRGNLS